MTFVLTGTLNRPRPDIQKDLKKLGAQVTGSVSKKTSALIAGEAGGSKIQKAEKAGVPIFSQEELDLLLDGKIPSALK